jgi:putrescine transport system substrate-binding protein
MGIPVRTLIAGCVLLACLTACEGGSTASEPVLNVYQWSDYVAPGVIDDFEREYGIKVNYDVFDSNEVLETKMLMGHSNFDVVAPSGPFLERQITAGVYQKLNKALLPNLKNVDPEVARESDVYNPGNAYGVTYMWITSGPGYNVAKIRERMPDAPVDSLRMIFDPTVVSKFQDCGVTMLDTPTEMLGAALMYMGRNPNSQSLEDLKAAEKTLLAIRPYIRYVHSSRYIDDLANGEVCLAMGWSGDVKQAHDRALEAGRGIELAFHIPKEGAMRNFDMVAIPADAPHLKNAHLFINFMLRPDIAARNSNFLKYANGVDPALQQLNPAVRNDPGIYPPPQVRAKLVPELAKSSQFTRLLNRMWTRFKTGE